MLSKIEKGKIGEMIAEEILISKGIKIIERNYRQKFGEIDLIGFEKKSIIFIEVRLKTGDYFGLAEESITLSKTRKIGKMIEYYISENEIDFDYRFDVVAIKTEPDFKIFEITWLKNQEIY